MSNPAIILYREFLRTVKKCYNKNVHKTMKKEIRYHFQGNALHNCETQHDIVLGYRIIKIMKENSKKK
jgi:hypothetical protein